MKINYKKILTRASLGAGTVGVIIAGAAAFSAYEAHIVNVTARIENALLVETTSLAFGTVFPQEYRTDQFVNVGLSGSFTAQNRLDDVEYVIKQKPKVKLCTENPIFDPNNPAVIIGYTHCAINNDTPSPGNSYATIHPFGNTTAIVAWKYCEENLPVDASHIVDLTNTYWAYCYLPLANSLSKHETTPDVPENDHGVDAFHRAYIWDNNGSHLDPTLIASGKLIKSQNDTSDSWTIDLKVPCFINQCDQAADDPTNLDPGPTGGPGFYVPEYARLDPVTQHSVFGTDLWIEVTGYSTP